MNDGVKYLRVYADYRKTDNPCTYDYAIHHYENRSVSVIKKELKKYFSTIYTWLKIYDVVEIDKSECSKWVTDLTFLNPTK